MYFVGKFQQFNYKKLKNLQMYKRNWPPLYNLSRTDCEIQIIYGAKDEIVPQIVTFVLI